jgi:hypothetical protein
MTIGDVDELHFITLMEIVPSIMQHGILSHNQARRLKVPRISDPLVQARRANKVIPNAGRLHDYANLYFHARNPMMCAIQARREELAVLRIRKDVLNLTGVIIADGNAASNYTRFFPSPDGLRALDRDLVFARDWRASDQITYWKRKRARCAEVLVPNAVDVGLIFGAFVCSDAAAAKLTGVAGGLAVTVESDIFTI